MKLHDLLPAAHLAQQSEKGKRYRHGKKRAQAGGTGNGDATDHIRSAFPLWLAYQHLHIGSGAQAFGYVLHHPFHAAHPGRIQLVYLQNMQFVHTDPLIPWRIRAHIRPACARLAPST